MIMNKKTLNISIMKCLCSEYHSVWLIDAKDLNVHVYVADTDNNASGRGETVCRLCSYPQAMEWYIENCIAEQDRQRIRKETAFENICEKISSGESYYIEFNRLCGESTNYYQMHFSRIVSDDDNEKTDCFILGIRDIDVRKKAERDDLTGLYTRQVFFQKAEKLLKDNPDVQYDLMISDIVDFKEINELYGPATGDDILRWAGSMLAPTISDDVVVGRYGGDQFVVLARHEVMQFIVSDENHKSYEALERSNGLPRVNTKFGVYENVKHNRSVISTCDKAHVALNSIKHHYKKAIAFYDDDLRREIEMHRKIESSMHQALEEEQFKVYYQPKHNAVSGKLVGAEALIRWIHPEYGFMSPGDFIPLFEKNGFVVQTDFYVWKRSCLNLKKWRDKGIKTVPISVNASKLTFEQNDLLKRLQSYVTENQLSPEQLHIEITETLMTYDVDALVKKLTAIRSVGYKIELDDFGSGFSSINILSTLPLDVIKLDMSFMKQFGDLKRIKVLAASINLAKELGFKTISEGVERREQCDMLSKLGVDAIQGYYFSKPLPEDEFEEYLIRNT